MLMIKERVLRSGSGSNPKVARAGTSGVVLVFARLEGITGIISILAHGPGGRAVSGLYAG